jgi:hypothetical protein
MGNVTTYFAPQRIPALIALLSVAALVVAVCAVFDPVYQTNDDIAMSMIAHGYGIAAYGSPNLVFSNVLWGHVVRAIPTINGVLGYALATVGVLVVSGWAVMYGLLRLGHRYLTALFAVALMLVLPASFPQFTVNAGLLTVAAIVGWRVYAQQGGRRLLAVSCLLAFFGYLIRDMEFLLVLGVALPLLPWKVLRERREMQVALLSLGVVIGAAAAFDRWSYSGPEWRQFKEFNQVRIPFTDYGAGERLKRHPEILSRYGYSPNDIDLITNWFFVDPKIANPHVLSKMLEELGIVQKNNISSGFDSIRALFHPHLLALLLPPLLILVLMPKRSVGFAWLLFLLGAFAIGFMGRPGVLRVYMPVLGMLLIAPLLEGKSLAKNYRDRAILLILFFACAVEVYVLNPSLQIAKQTIEHMRNDNKILPAYIFNMAVSFPSEYAVFPYDQIHRKIKVYSLDAFTLAPFSVANVEYAADRGMLMLLRRGDEIPIALARPSYFRALNTYCAEHLNGRLNWTQTQHLKAVTFLNIRCE